MDPITLLIYVLVFLIILAIVWYFGNALGVPQQPLVIILLVVTLVFALWLLRSAGLW